MYQVKKEEKSSSALKIVLMHQIKDWKNTLNRAEEVKLLHPVKQEHVVKQQNLETCEEKLLHLYFKIKISDIAFEMTRK